MKLLLTGALAFALISTAHAAAFQNGSFEANNPLVIGPDFSTVPVGWSKNDPTGNGLFLETYNTFGLPVVNAAGTAAFGFGGNGATTGTLAQTFDTVAGATYNVAFQYVLQQGIELQSLQVAALNGNTNLGTSQILHFGNIAWAFGTFSFVATGSQSTLIFTDISGAQDGPGLSTNWALDGVSVSTQAITGPSVPEPATCGLVGFACLIGLAHLRARRL